MNLSQVDEKIIQLMNQYSNNGNLTLDTTNADYLLRTRNLIDACQKELCKKFPVIEEEKWSQTSIENPTDFITHALPANCSKVLSLTLSKYPSYQPLQYKKQKDSILIDPTIEGNLILKYEKTPDTINKDTLGDTGLELDNEYQEIIPYYVAGWIYLDENQTVGTMLLNEYQRKIQVNRAYEPANSENIEDVYANICDY